MLNQFKSELCWLKLHQISLYFIITQLNHVSPVACRAKKVFLRSPLFCINSASKYHVIRKLTNETHIRNCLTHLITKTTTAKRCLKKQSNEDLVLSKVCKTSLIQLSMPCIYTRENLERWGSCFRSYSEYSLYSIFANALKQARRIQRDDCMRFMMKTAAMTLGQGLWVWDVSAPCSG